MSHADDPLFRLHLGLPREGPGDEAFTRALLARLPPLPARPRIADLGCGSGAGARVLARWFGAPVVAVDTYEGFLGELRARAGAEGIDGITTLCADFGALDWPPGSVDLLWSEGAAYLLGFEEALRRWRPLVAPGGVVVLSELTWFTSAPSPQARAFWEAAYPDAGTEAENRARAARAGFRVVFTERLPSEAWWRSYYDPLRRRMSDAPREGAAAEVVAEMEREIALFADHSAEYGYTFYVLVPDAEPTARTSR